MLRWLARNVSVCGWLEVLGVLPRMFSSDRFLLDRPDFGRQFAQILRVREWVMRVVTPAL